MNNLNIEKEKPMENDNSEQVNGFVRWTKLIPMALTFAILLTTLIGGVGAYAISSNKEYIHPDVVRFREIEPLGRDIDELKADVREVRKMLSEYIMKK